MTAILDHDDQHDLWKGGPEWADLRREAKPAASAPHPDRVLCDYSYAKPLPEHVKVAGVVVYTSRNASKVPSKAHVQRLLALGRTVSWVGQDGGHQALRGALGGRDDAAWYNAQLDMFGVPPWAPVAYAVADYDAPAADLRGPIRDYVGAALQARLRPVGVYGGIRTIDYLHDQFGDLIAWYWQAVAWSGGRVSPHAHLLQQAGAPWYPIPGVATDDNVILKPFPRWGMPAPSSLTDADRDQLHSAGLNLATTARLLG